MTGKQIIQTVAGGFFGYSLLHLWKPITFDWTPVPFLPGYDPNEKSIRGTNWPALAATTALAALIVARSSK